MNTGGNRFKEARAFAIFSEGASAFAAVVAEHYGGGVAAYPSLVAATRASAGFPRIRPKALDREQRRFVESMHRRGWEHEIGLRMRLTDRPSRRAHAALEVADNAFWAIRSALHGVLGAMNESPGETHAATARAVANLVTGRSPAPSPFNIYLALPGPASECVGRGRIHGVDARSFRHGKLDALRRFLVLTACTEWRRRRDSRRAKEQAGPGRPLIVTPYHAALCMRLQADHKDNDTLLEGHGGPDAARAFHEAVTVLVSAGITVLDTVSAAYLGGSAYEGIAERFAFSMARLWGEPFESEPAVDAFIARTQAIVAS